MELAGYIAAALTSLCWSGTSIFFTLAGRRIGSNTVNQIRIVFAVSLLMASHLILLGTLWPLDASARQLGLLALSGLIGLALGDTCYFASLIVIGPKRAAVCMSLAPAATAILAWPMIGESLVPVVILGMAITISGVALAQGGAKKQKDLSGESASRLGFGVVLGLLGAFGQGAGIVVAKLGMLPVGVPPQTSMSGIENVVAATNMGGDFNALSATLVRMSAGAILLWIIAGSQQIYCRRKGVQSKLARGLGDARGVIFTLCGAAVGPFIGVWLSLFSVKNANSAVAMTIMATFPILVIPQTMLVFKEKPRLAEFMGAVVAIAGVAVLMLPKIFPRGFGWWW